MKMIIMNIIPKVSKLRLPESVQNGHVQVVLHVNGGAPGGGGSSQLAAHQDSAGWWWWWRPPSSTLSPTVILTEALRCPGSPTLPIVSVLLTAPSPHPLLTSGKSTPPPPFASSPARFPFSHSLQLPFPRLLLLPLENMCVDFDCCGLLDGF